MAGPTHQAREFARGLWLPVEGARLIAADARLLLLSILPITLTLVATAATGIVAWLHGKALLSRVWPVAGACTDCGVGRWLWSRLELFAFDAAFMVLVLLAAAVAGLIASRVLAAPAMDALSRRAMRRMPADRPDFVPLGDRPLAVQLWQSVLRALGHALVYLAGAGAIALIALIPGGAMVATPLQVVWAAAWLFVDTMLYPLQWTGDARLSDCLAVIRQRPALAFGFTAGQALLLFIPLAALVVTPVAIAGACLLVEAVPPPSTPELVAAAPA